jgi:hypothetical protein
VGDVLSTNVTVSLIFGKEEKGVGRLGTDQRIILGLAIQELSQYFSSW